MTRDQGRRTGSNAPTGDGAATRRPTRRGFLAAAATAGAGLAAVGVLAGDDGPEGRSAPASGAEEDAVANAGGGDDERDAERVELPADAPVLGANLNGRPHRLRDNLGLVDASDTTWVRAFFDVRRKLENGVAPGDDPDVVALRQAALERDCKLILSLKWDFKANWGDKERINVPRPGSNFEGELFECATRYLRAIGTPVDTVVLGNEPMWETVEEDIRVDDPPIAEFTRRAKEYLVEHGDHGDPAYLVGAFNRAHNDGIREEWYPQFYREMFEMVREDEDVDGVDLHVHYGAFRQAEAAVAVAREAVPDGTIAVTEFSPVWRYHRHVHSPIAESEAGERFARDHDLPEGMTAVEYFEHAKRNPRPPEEVADFYDAMPWYNVNHVADVYDLFADYDVSVATFGFMQGLGMRNEDWTENWSPFHINFLFQPALIRTDDGIENTANLHYIEDYRERAVRDEPGSN